MDKNYSTSILVNTTPQEVCDAINNVPAWWSANFEGNNQKQNDVFTVRFDETFITMKITEFLPGSKLVWHVIDCYKHWLKDKKEWNGTTITWSLSPAGAGTKIEFMHIGLIPGIECYNGCEKAWNYYIHECLLPLLLKGKKALIE